MCVGYICIGVYVCGVYEIFGGEMGVGYVCVWVYMCEVGMDICACVLEWVQENKS